jgi:undecaprenyl pyrophosphate phosphatase UppP
VSPHRTVTIIKLKIKIRRHCAGCTLLIMDIYDLTRLKIYHPGILFAFYTSLHCVRMKSTMVKKSDKRFVCRYICIIVLLYSVYVDGIYVININ